MTGVVAPANALDATVNTATLTSVEFESSTFTNGSMQQLTVGWEADASDGRPVEVRVDLPEELYGHPDSFVITDQSGGRAGECDVTATNVICSLDDAYLQAHQGPIEGSFTFSVIVTVTTSEELTRVFRFGDIESGPVTITPKDGPCTENCEYSGQEGSKSGRYGTTDETIEWTVFLPATEQGLTPLGASVTVTDNMDLTKFEIVGDPVIYRAGSVYLPTSGNAPEYPSYSNTLSPDEYTLSADKRSVTFTAAPGLGADVALPDGQRGLEGSIYMVNWKVKVLDLGALGTYSNSAHWEIDGVVSEEVTTSVTRSGGSGNVIAEDRGKFAITKALADGSEAPADAEFTLNWTQYDLDNPDAVGMPGTTQLQVGDTFFSAEIRPNTRVVIHEVLPADPAGFEWGAPQFIETNASGVPLLGATPSESITLDFTDAPSERLGYVSYFTLTNSLTALPIETGSFSISKTIAGSAASRVPAGTEFEVAYSWPAGDTYAAGGGSIMIPASGAAVTVDGIPEGATVTLVEGELPAIEGTAWGTPVISPNGFEIIAGSVVTVTLTNTLEPVTPPVDPVDPTDPTDPPVKPVTPPAKPAASHPLAKTGNNMSPLWIVVPVLLVAAGGLLLASRRRQTDRKANDPADV